MPLRRTVFADGETYHVLNRSLHGYPIFVGKRECNRFIKLLNYYSFLDRPTRFSKYLKLSNNQRKIIMKKLKAEDKRRVKLICYCLMPNHFHLLIRQECEQGTTRFMSDIQNSYVRYFNTKNNRKGPLFQGQFKAVRILSENQLLHVSRYIHLNPYSGFVVKNLKGLVNYKWSSLLEYLNLVNKNLCLCFKEVIMSGFSNPDKYKEFVFSRADYQRDLEQIKHLILE